MLTEIQAMLKQPTSAGFNLALLSLLVVFALLLAVTPVIVAAQMAALLPIADGAAPPDVRVMCPALPIGVLGLWALPRLSRKWRANLADMLSSKA